MEMESLQDLEVSCGSITRELKETARATKSLVDSAAYGKPKTFEKLIQNFVGYVYEGEWSNGKMNGTGKEIYKGNFLVCYIFTNFSQTCH